MTYLKTLRQDVQDWLEDEGDNAEVDRALNRAIEEVETYQDWEVLKDSDTQTPDSDGIIRAPADSRVIRRVFPVGAYELPEFTFRPKSELDALDKPITTAYKLWPHTMNKSALSSGLLVDLVQNSQTVTQAVSSADNIDVAWVGERIQFEGDETYYEITAATASTDLTVYPDVRRESGSSQIAQVRPLGLEQYKVTDYQGQPYTDDVQIKYQVKHPALVSNTDQLLIPARQTVVLTAVKFFLHQTKYDVDARQLSIDLAQARDRECNQQATASPESVGVKSTFSLRSKRGNRSIR